MIPANQLSPVELAGILREAGLPYKSRSHADLINDVNQLRANEEPTAGPPASNAEEDDGTSEDNPLKDTGASASLQQGHANSCQADLGHCASVFVQSSTGGLVNT